MEKIANLSPPLLSLAAMNSEFIAVVWGWREGAEREGRGYL